MPDKKKGVTGHEDLDARIDQILEKHGGSISPSSPGWNRVMNMMDKGRERDNEAKAKSSPAPAAEPKKRGRPKKDK